jgi:hypothetical protein
MSDSGAKTERAPRAAVGPVLEAGPMAQAVIAAIRSLHPEVQVLDRGAYLRVSVPGRCVLELGVLEHELGHAFRLPGDLERIMPSFQGRLRLSATQVVWEERTR